MSLRGDAEVRRAMARWTRDPDRFMAWDATIDGVYCVVARVPSEELIAFEASYPNGEFESSTHGSFFAAMAAADDELSLRKEGRKG